MKLVFSIFTLLLASTWSLYAQATLSVQGTIQKSFGAAVDEGEYSLTFRLYTTDAGGTPVWSETQDGVQIIGGVYSVVLGTIEPLTAAFDQAYYLGISVDGGQELLPRARLTASPYALSLIGQDNIFPSTGAVGAGTATPEAGAQLHVKNASGDGKVIVEGTDAAKIVLKKGSSTQTISYNGTAMSVPGVVNLSGTANIDTLVAANFNYSPTNFAVSGKLAVGQTSVDANNALKVQGNSVLNGFLDITAAPSIYVPVSVYVNGGLNVWTGGNVNLSARASGDIQMTNFRVTSDRRIKKDLRLSDKTNDLSTLLKLRVTDYRHVDEIANGTGFVKGFIAQEVEEMFPEAVRQSEYYIPDVYALSTRTQLSSGKMTISLEKNHTLAVGDEVKMMLSDCEKIEKVIAVPSENSFVVDWDSPATDKIFVYGRQVKDFRTVIYDRIFTLNVSATQELARQVEELKADNEALRKENQELRNGLNSIESRLSKMENLATGTAQK